MSVGCMKMINRLGTTNSELSLPLTIYYSTATLEHKMEF